MRLIDENRRLGVDLLAVCRNGFEKRFIDACSIVDNRAAEARDILEYCLVRLHVYVVEIQVVTSDRIDLVRIHEEGTFICFEYDIGDDYRIVLYIVSADVE